MNLKNIHNDRHIIARIIAIFFEFGVHIVIFNYLFNKRQLCKHNDE